MNRLMRTTALVSAAILAGRVQAGYWMTSVHDGAFTNRFNWGGYVCPTNAGDTIGFSFSKGLGDYRITASDVVAKSQSFTLYAYTGNSWLFDGADSTFTMAALADGETEHATQPIVWYAGYGRPATQFFNCQRAAGYADTRASVCCWSNALVAITNSSNKDISLSFSRGAFSFAGADGTDNRMETKITNNRSVNDGKDPGYGAADPIRTFALNYSNVTSVYGNLLIGAWALEGTTTTVSGGKLTVLGDLNTHNTGTNASAFVVKDGAQVTVNGTFKMLPSAVADWPEGKDVRLAVTNAELTVKTAFAPTGAVALEFGAGARVVAETSLNMSGTCALTLADGAQLETPTLEASDATSGAGPSVAVSGAETSLTAPNLGVGDNCSMMVSGGEITASEYLYVGYSGGLTTDVASHLTQTGGRITASHTILCRTIDSEYRKVYLTLDGGEVRSGNLYGSRTKINGYKGYAQLSANGGTYRAREKYVDTSYPFIGGIDRAELGPKGLTIATDYENLVLQDFTNKVGETGRLFLTGSGNVRIGTNSHQTELVSDVATVTFESGLTEYASRVVATNGTVVSFANAAALALEGLTLAGGSTLSVGSATRLTAAAVDLSDVKVNLSGTFADGTYPLLVVKGRVSAATREEWILAELLSARTSGKTYNFRCGDYDETAQTTTLSLVIGPTYTPTVTDAETLPAAIDSLYVLGALAFTQAKDYVITGSGKLFFEESGNGLIDVASGDQAVRVETWLAGMLAVNVPGGASLTFVQPILHGGLDKSGTGELVFGANAACELPLGLKLRDGTWKVEGADVASKVAVTIQSPNPSNAVVLATAVDTTVPGLTVSSGAIVKTGVGALTVENADTSMQLYGDWSIHGKIRYGSVIPDGTMDFPADGTPPTMNYSAFNVVEGEMALRGTGADTPTASSQYFNTAEVFVGMRSPLDVAAAPGLVIDHAKVDLGGMQRHIWIGTKPIIADTLGKANSPYVVISNKADVTSHMVYFGNSSDSSETADIYPKFTLDDATWRLNVSNAGKLELSGGKTCHTTFDIRNGSTFQAGNNAVIWKGEANVTVDGDSLFAGLTADAACTFQFGANAKGTFAVSSNAMLRCSGATFAAGVKKLGDRVDFVFDGGYLDPVATDFTFATPLAGCHLVARAGGLKLAVPEGGTWTLPAIVEGTGPIVACGEGTVALSGTFTNAFAGAGTFAGGTLNKATVKLAVDDAGMVVGGVPTFDGASYDGRVRIDLGRTAESPIDLAKIHNLTVMNFTGTVPASFKLVGTGLPKASGNFRTEAGRVILVSADHGRGLMVLVR